jgi:branched-subunit amino acid ABC-type transport system permease component
MNGHLLLLSVGFGVVTASVLALASVGLTVQFGVTNYVNFAYGAFLTVAAYLTWQLSSGWGLSFLVAGAIAALGMGAVAVATERFVLRQFTSGGSALFYLLIVTFGLSLILDNVIQAIWGTDFHIFPIPSATPLNLGPFLLTNYQVVIIGVAIVAMFGIHLLLTRTTIGKAMRAMSDDSALASVSGIDTQRITMITWFLSGFLAGLAGVALAVTEASFQPSTGDDFLFIIFAAVILGGIGQPYGAMLGALIIGIATEVSAAIIPAQYKGVVAFAILVIMLLARPQGLVPTRGKA